MRTGDFDPTKLEQILEGAEAFPLLTQRIEYISGKFLECPYKVSPLVGSLSEEEHLVADFDCFDCVTFIETVLAATFAWNTESFLQTLTELRYHHGEISWAARNHYSVDWIARNQEQGYVKNITPAELSVAETRTLSLLEGYPARVHQISYLPLQKLSDFQAELQTGDLLYFGTTRENLDVSHVGFFIRQDESLVLRHSTKSLGCTLDELLSSFLERFGATPGLIIVRPIQK